MRAVDQLEPRTLAEAGAASDRAIETLRYCAEGWGVGAALINGAFAILALLGFVLMLGGCQTVPVKDACGVIRDNLATVKATTPGGQQRLDVHFERGKAAGCW